MAAPRPLRRRARNPWVRRFKLALYVLSATFLIVLSVGLAVYIPIYQEASDDALNIEKRLVVLDSKPTVILSADNKVLYSAAAIRRTVVDLTKTEYPAYIRYALVAAEDRRFYDHRGVDPLGLLRAAYRRGGGGGGSTISMQLAKLLINGDAHSLRRKLKDIATAQQIEALKSKDEILNLYANVAYYGQHAFGIERASEVYFGKPAERLTVGEAAMLARCVRLPSRFNPVKTPEKMLDYRDYVLGVMRDEGWITQGQYDEGVHEVPKLAHGKVNGQTWTNPVAGYFVRHVRIQLGADFDNTDFESGGYTIHTTLNYALQKRAIKAVDETLAEYRGQKVNDGAVVVMDQQGRILAEVGGPDYERRQYNVIMQGQGHQPGSSFKAIVLATALKNGVVHPGDILSNARIHLPLDRRGRKWWDPENASRSENLASYSVENAFALSVNRPFIHTIIATEPKNVVAAAHDVFGIKSPLDAVPALALGSSSVKPIEMLEAYSVFMLNGDRAEPQPIVDVLGPDGTNVRTYETTVRKAVLNPKVASEMDDILKCPVQFGTATFAQAVPNARGKTGTTNDHKDAWFCGYSDGLVGVAWTGNTSKRGLPLQMGSGVFGGTVPVKIWTAVMVAAHDLHLANGIRTTPGTTVKVVASPDEDEVPADPVDRPARRRHRVDDAPPADAEPTDVPPASDPTPVAPPATDVDPKDPDLKDPDLPPTTPPDEAMTTPPVDPPKRRSSSRRTEPSKPKPKEAETETVEICVDTGLKANAYCNETVTRTFPKGRGPRKYCTLHHG